MDTAKVEANLKARILESKNWIEEGPAPITGIKLRGYSWIAQPVEFLDDSNRKERHGIGFRFFLDSDNKNIAVRLNVRIKPEAEITPNGDSPAYVVVYVVNQLTGADESLMHQHLDRPTDYADLMTVELDEWYLKWIRAALHSGNQSKIFRKEMALPATP